MISVVAGLLSAALRLAFRAYRRRRELRARRGPMKVAVSRPRHKQTSWMAMSPSSFSVLASSLLAVLVPSASALGDGRDRRALVGVAEDAILDREGYPHQTVVHVAFERKDGEWGPVGEPPSRLNWTACFAGREVGSVASRSPENPPEASRRRKAHEPVPGSHVPFVGKPSAAFAGWMGGEVHRPLVVTTGHGCRDPEHWRPSAPPQGVLKRLVSELRKVTKDIYDCGPAGDHGPYSFPDGDIVTLTSHVSDSSSRIVSLSVRVPADLAERCGVTSGSGWEPHTFVVLPDGQIRHLGSGLTLLDAGDYDGDGYSELVFFVARYDAGGYALFRGNLPRLVSYEWNYH